MWCMAVVSSCRKRKVRMTPSHHAPYALGDTRATMAGTKGSRSREGELTPKTRPQFGLQAATRLHEAGIAAQSGAKGKK
ncbi:hypothetical protein L1887_22789 [Cichorium endivia]|nr:hypothetical protein L1887_22789 [Cichorium endivia]